MGLLRSLILVNLQVKVSVLKSSLSAIFLKSYIETPPFVRLYSFYN